MKPRLLDLFCGAGGAAMGYHRAGFEVVGVDIKPQPRYPFEFIQEDAMAFLQGHRSTNGFHDYAKLTTEDFHAIHASPPCQAYSKALRHLSAPQLELIDGTRDLLEDTGLPWVLENVPGAPLPAQDTLDGRYGLLLCGTMLGLPRVRRHRLFETSFPLTPPGACNHSLSALNPYNASSRERDGIELGAEATYAEAMGVPWMQGKRGDQKSEIGEAIPPAYTEFIGVQLMSLLMEPDLGVDAPGAGSMRGEAEKSLSGEVRS